MRNKLEIALQWCENRGIETGAIVRNIYNI
jgi:hypothetical protein